MNVTINARDLDNLLCFVNGNREERKDFFQEATKSADKIRSSLSSDFYLYLES